MPRGTGGKNKGSKTPRLLVRKGKTGKAPRKESKLSDEVKGNANDTATDGTRKFRRKCTKYQRKRRNAGTSGKS